MKAEEIKLAEKYLYKALGGNMNISTLKLKFWHEIMTDFASQQCFNEKEQNKRMREWFSERTGLGDDILLSKHMEKVNEQCQKRDELIKAVNDYATFLGECLDKHFMFLHVHGEKASDEEIKRGEELRAKIEQLKSEIDKR